MSIPSEQQSRSEMEAEDSNHFDLEDIYKLLKKEAETPSLQAIDLDTFQKIATSLSNLKAHNYEDIGESKIRDRMVDLIANSTRLLIEARQHKILRPDNNEPLDYSKLTDEEKYILEGERESGKRISEVIAATINGRAKVLQSISARVRARQIVVRFLKPMEQFIGVDMSKYGPFQPEDVATLPFENARSMIETDVAVEVRIE
jgi:DNA replication factor GINS